MAIALYPFKFKRAPRRNLAVSLRDSIVDEHGREWRKPDSYLDLRRLVIEKNLILFVVSIPFVESAIACSDSVNYVHSRHSFNGIRIRSGRGSHVIALTESWPGLLDDPDSLSHLRRLFDLLDCGDHSGPASLGQSLVRRLWPRGAKRLSAPPLEAWHDLHSNLTGGRSDLLRPGRWRYVNEEDVNGAYVWALNEIPTGHVVSLRDTRRDDPIWGDHQYPWFFAKYSWTKPRHDIPLPVLGYRSRTGQVYYPTNREDVGRHDGWYTKQEVYTAMLHGYDMRFVEGWAWTATANPFSSWIKAVDSYRHQFAGTMIETWIKLMAVASIGRFGCDHTRYSVVRWDRAKLDDPEDVELILDQDTGELLYAVERVEDSSNPELLAHIAAKVHADVRLKTLFRAEPYAKAKRLVATNYDAIYYAGDPLPSSISDALGEWKRKELWNATFPARRWVLADGKRKTPGLEHEHAA